MNTSATSLPATVQIVQHLRPGGIETMSLDLLDHLYTHNGYIVSLEGDADSAIAHWPRLKAYRSRLRFLAKPEGRSWKTLARLCWLLHRLDASAIHTHHIGPLFYGGLAARLLGIRHRIHTEHDGWHLANPQASSLQKRLLKQVQPTLVADCPEVADQLNRVAPDYPVATIFNGIDTHRFTPSPELPKSAYRHQFGLPEEVRMIGVAARLEPVKAINNLLVAMTQLDDDVHLAIAGDGSERRILEMLCEDFQLTERVHFLGAQDEMPDFYRALDLFCLSSLKEGLPLSPLEAQASGVPVVLTHTGGCADICCPHSGQLVKPGNCTALATALRYRLDNPLATNIPRAFVLRTASLETTVQAYGSLLNQGV